MTTNGHPEPADRAGRELGPHSGPITEAELLAGIEGDAADRVGSNARVAAMRADRAVLRGLARDAAPDGLLEAALDEALGEIDGDTLRKLGEGTPTSDRLPVSRVLPERFSLVTWLRAHPQRVALAAAAVVVLAVGTMAGLAVRGWLRASPVSSPPIAMEHGARPAAPAESAAAQDPVHAAPTSNQPGEAVIAESTPTDTGEAPGQPDFFAGAKLLAEGRLYVLARGGSSAKVGAALKALTDQRIGPDHSWEIAMGMPGSALASLDLPEIRQPVFASDDTEAVEVILPRRSAWTAKLSATPTALAALVDGLRDAGLEVTLHEVAKPVAIEPRLDADDVLWWSRPPSTWKRTVAAPVVVETLP
ncbi:MAG: hypothetical protein H6810_06525 [Phycisphaeraceae bacterium]|nr:MAG: hypothetical protein H6810_06525 [Phycisphaeraceae bacterium]